MKSADPVLARAFGVRLALAATAACCALGLLAAPAQNAGAPLSTSVSTQSVFLTRCESVGTVANWGLGVTSQPQVFTKEPATAARKVCRGVLQLAGSADQAVPFLWDYTQGKLYLDLNRNRNLTDDASGIFSCPLPRFSGYYYQTFTNVQLSFKTPEGDYPVSVDLSFYNPGSHPTVTAACRSFWAGRISLQEQDWQVGLVEGTLNNKLKSTDGTYLLLRPWQAREQVFNTTGGSLETFAFTPNLFLGGRAYRLTTAFLQREGGPGYELTFSERPSELGELRITGKFIERVMLAETRPKQGRAAYTVILDNPAPTVKIPVGSYNRWQVQLKAGEVEAFRDGFFNGGDQPLVTVASQGTNVATLAAGGPLTNLVSLGRRGRFLSLDYRLNGADGAQYQLARADRSKPPGFVIYRNGKVLDSGKFEFG